MDSFCCLKPTDPKSSVTQVRDATLHDETILCPARDATTKPNSGSIGLAGAGFSSRINFLRQGALLKGGPTPPIPLVLVDVQTRATDSSSGRSTMNGSRYSPRATREVWQKEGKQRWDGRTHGRGHCLLIVDLLALIPGRPGSPNRSFEFWRDQNKIRGRFIGDALANGIVVARLNEDRLPVP